MSEPLRWSARRILSELATPELRREIAIAFWRHSEPQQRAATTAQLARAMNFRPEFLRKASVEKKADWLLQRSALHELHESLEMALMIHHTTARASMMGEFLDRWDIPHENGAIEEEEYGTPDEASVRSAVAELRQSWDPRDIAIYLATAGLLMGTSESGWREATWPVVDELASELAES